ncbi:MAG: type II CRISPR-associated endonuclease Cas1 [Gammaproteobacteria bacterium]|nr:type II CRISPR-associated endonuclease Cas1 [Gammaproteobacteria bacterium]
MERILDISERALRLRLKNGCLDLLEDGRSVQTPIPLAEVGAVVVSNPEATFSRALLSELAEHGVSTVVCNSRSLPVAMLLPLSHHSLQSERMQAQLELGRVKRKQLHAQVVKAKLLAQAALLEELHGRDHGLRLLARRVASGDKGNNEAKGARLYWRVLFGAPFTRDPEQEGRNALLNYGYAVLRAMVGRAIAGVGLHPGLGLFHHNRYNPFCLADDLMEPYRPLVDRAVVLEADDDPWLSPEWKRRLLSPLVGRYQWQDEERGLMDWLHRLARSLAGVCLGEKTCLEIPHCLLPVANECETD